MGNILTDYLGDELNINELLDDNDNELYIQLLNDSIINETDNHNHSLDNIFKVISKRGKMLALDIAHGKLSQGMKFNAICINKKNKIINNILDEDYDGQSRITFITDSSLSFNFIKKGKIIDNGNCNDNNDKFKMIERGTILIKCSNLIYGRMDRPKSPSPLMPISINNF